MIIKKTFNDLLVNLPENVSTFFDYEFDMLEAVDDLMYEKTGGTSEEHETPLHDLFENICNNYLSPNGFWKDMLVFISSYKEHDSRIFYSIQHNLLAYIGFYKKILTDDGIVRNIVSSNNTHDERIGDSENANINTVTPQNTGLYDETTQKISDPLFEKAIADYASDMGKDKTHSASSGTATSTTTVSGVSWKEAMNNVRMIYFNELVNYLMKIPQMVYDFYALDTMPVPALVHKYFENLKASFNWYE